MVNQYYEILGVQPGASLDEIKKAYRSKAKEYHPDISTAPDAKEKFMLVQEAYEFLTNPQARQRRRPSGSSGPAQQRQRAGNPYGNAQSGSDWQQEVFRQWAAQHQQAAQQRARQYSNMRYREFEEITWGKFARYIGLRMLGCFGSGLIAVFLLVIAYRFSSALGFLFLILFLPITAFVYINAQDVFKWIGKKFTGK